MANKTNVEIIGEYLADNKIPFENPQPEHFVYMIRAAHDDRTPTLEVRAYAAQDFVILSFFAQSKLPMQNAKKIANINEFFMRLNAWVPMGSYVLDYDEEDFRFLMFLDTEHAPLNAARLDDMTLVGYHNMVDALSMLPYVMGGKLTPKQAAERIWEILSDMKENVE